MSPGIQPSYNTLLSSTALGKTITTRPMPEWKHPWFTDAIWLPKEGVWGAVVRAGFVNGQAPMVRTTAGALREAAGTFYGQIIDARSGAAESSQAAQLAASDGVIDASIPDSALVDVPLCQNPPIRLSKWRNIGWDGAGAVPLFFQLRGVHPPPSGGDLSSVSSSVAAAALTPPKENRLLRACDIILHQPRTALTSQITITGAGLITGVSNVRQTLGFLPPASVARLSLQTGTFSAAGSASLDFQGAADLLASNFEEKTWDELLVSTVYLLSPANAPLDAVPNASWQAFSKHSLFWNLSWQQPSIQPVFNSDIFAGLVGLVSVIGGGAGIGTVNYTAASINDATQSALNILQAQSLAGSFWSPTGGGTDSTLPQTPTKSKITLDKTANNLSAALAAAKQTNYQLDPVFPFTGVGFNLSLINP